MPGLVGARRRAATSPSLRSTGARDGPAAAGVLNGQKTWTPAGGVRTHSSACSAPTRPPSATAASPTSWSRSTPTGVTVRPIGQLDGDDGFAEVFFDDVVRARRRRPRRARRGLAGGDGHDRLRARPDPALPGRFLPTADRLVELGRATAAAPDCAAATGWSTPGWRPRPTSSRPRSPSPGSPTAGRSGAEARSTSCSGPSSTSRCTRPRSTSSAPTAELRRRPWIEGLPVLAGRPDLRRHQRDPAQHRRRARARPAPRAEAPSSRGQFGSRPRPVRDVLDEPADQRRHRGRGARWAAGDPAPARAVARLAEQASTASLCPRSMAGRAHPVDPVLAFEEPGRSPSPARWSSRRRPSALLSLDDRRALPRARVGDGGRVRADRDAVRARRGHRRRLLVVASAVARRGRSASASASVDPTRRLFARRLSTGPALRAAR